MPQKNDIGPCTMPVTYLPRHVTSRPACCCCEISAPAYVSFGSWLCENSSARRARRNISKKLRTMESKRAPRTVFDTLLENCIFYISQLYEFSHRLGQYQSFGDVRSMSGLPESGHG